MATKPSTISVIIQQEQKPFEAGLVETIEDIEDREIYEGLENQGVNVKKIKGFNPSRKEKRDFLEGLQQVYRWNLLSSGGGRIFYLNLYQP